MMDKCVIFAGGDPVRKETVSTDITGDAYIICADKGLQLAHSIGIKEDVILGDFDSLGHKPEGGNVMTFPVEKDDTDLMLAVRTALEQGHKRFYIYGACGGRLDHMMGNIACLSMITDNGAKGTIIGDDEIVSMYDPCSFTVPYKEGFSLSLFAYAGKVSGLYISGTKYTADGFSLDPSVTLGVSNEITADKAEISFTHGRLLVIQSRLR